MLQISNPRERWLVQAADAALGVVSAAARPFARRRGTGAPRRILLLRLERIGDLVMALPAIRDVRVLAPDAEVDLVVGSWNAGLARAIPHVSAVMTADASWLAREREGEGVAALVARARGWRPRRYDLAINFEPDIRSNLMTAASGAARTVGWASGGGGPVLDVALDYDPTAHTSANARRLVAAAFGRAAPESARPLLSIPDQTAAAAAARLRIASARPLVGIHVSGGRPIKHWPGERFAEVAARLADLRGAALVATGGAADRQLVDAFVAAVAPRPVVDVAGSEDLVETAALIGRLDVLVTGDTGPMHLASAVGTPVVAVFGPSDPARYAPQGARDRIVRIDLPCSPCNRVRLPPARCVGHTPDCLSGLAAQQVVDAALDVLDTATARVPRAGRP
jgi:lipopolysaccharide heptosyltransferase II